MNLLVTDILTTLGLFLIVWMSVQIGLQIFRDEPVNIVPTNPGLLATSLGILVLMRIVRFAFARRREASRG